MVTAAETKLNNIRAYLKELGEAIDSLEKFYSDIFHDPELKSWLELFHGAHREALERLAAPSLCIATLGTTSSGKSTIVNALIGRRIAPIEAGEMSGGVLTLRHSDENKIIVEATEGAEWYTGEQTGLSDEELYDLICEKVIRPYHDTRRKKDCMAPKVKVFCPLLPGSDPNLLDLPTGVGVELIDLPGLKSVQDRDNLTVIQEQVTKAFSIVALDYGQVDDAHRKRLLEELKNVVKHLRGRTDSMLFILNKVDNRGNDDFPITERIYKLRQEIREVLSLKELPEVLPFSARLLYYAQCAWGLTAPESPSSVAQPTRLKLLTAMIKECSPVIMERKLEDNNLWNRFSEIERQVASKADISDETMREVLQYAREWSGGSELWNRLRTRVQESFSELVILPALVEFFEYYDALAKAIDTLAEIRKIETKEAVEAELVRISESRQRLKRSIQNLRQKFCTYTQGIIERLKKNDQATRSRLAQEVKEKGLKGFQVLFEALEVVEGDLIEKLIIPVRDALKDKQEAYLLEDNLSEVTTPMLIKDIARAYESVSRGLSDFQPDGSGSYLFKRVREDDERGKRELEVAERATRKLYQAMREALSTRAQFSLQAQAQKFEEALQGVVCEQERKIGTLCTQELPSLKLDEAVMAVFKQKLEQNLPTLPESFFKASVDLQQDSSMERTRIGQEKVTKTREVGSCFKKTETYTEYEDKYRDVKYNKLQLPDVDMMARQWSEGIAQEREKLWDILSTWILERLTFASNEFDKSLNDVLNLAERELQRQNTIIEQNFEAELQRWSEIESQKAEATKIRQKLAEESLTSRAIEEK